MAGSNNNFESVKYVSVNKGTIHAVIEVDIARRKFRTVYCTNRDLCRDLNILNPGGLCPGYCEIVVAAKDYAFSRRKPKAEVRELSPEDVADYYDTE